MKKATNESVIIARHINAFLSEYVPSQKSRSSQTLKSYQYALALYISFLETEKGIRAESLCGGCFSRIIIEEWLRWLMEQRGCSPETCNNRLALNNPVSPIELIYPLDKESLASGSFD